MSIYTYQAKTIRGEEKQLSEYEGKVVLIVNTASKCGFTPQYKELQALYDKYQEQGFVVLGFPSNQFMNQEPGTNQEIEEFCQVNYGVTFPIFEKVEVKGANAHPLFQYLTKSAPGFLSKEVKWNFTKFLINKQGDVVKRYAPTTNPKSIEQDIERLLAE